jgi:adenine-specific DNA methylase
MSAILKDITIGDCRLILGDCLKVMPLLSKFDAVVTDPPYVMLSYNDEGIVSHDDIKSDMSKYGQVTKVTLDHKRYRAINQDGSHSKTKESIFVLKRN